MPSKTKRKTRIMIDKEKCTGCKACMLACAVKHTGRYSTSMARIWVNEIDEMVVVPNVCRHCVAPACMRACSAGAIKKEGELVVLDIKKCTGCRACVDACPFGAIKYSEKLKKALKCDLCDGEPECIKACIPGAIY
ncbi:MAG: 4Fe-4S dicluster domain-containing protein [Thermoplasmata archaeon]|nr:4Fe-4S dicluster domain-containing protein [Thermoplasmata archaeon]